MCKEERGVDMQDFDSFENLLGKYALKQEIIFAWLQNIKSYRKSVVKQYGPEINKSTGIWLFKTDQSQVSD